MSRPPSPPLVSIAIVLAACPGRELEQPAEPAPIEGTLAWDGFGGAASTSSARLDLDFAPVGDIDGDGRDDLALFTSIEVDTTPEPVRLLFGRDERLTRHFPIEDTTALDVPRWSWDSRIVALPDLDGDGIQELGLQLSEDLRVLKGGEALHVDGEPRAWRTIACTGESDTSWGASAVGDLDGDGFEDLGLSGYGWVSVTSGRLVASASGALDCHDGVLIDDREPWFRGDWAVLVPAGDLDADGFDDMIAETATELAVFYGASELGTREPLVIEAGDAHSGFVGIGRPASEPVLLTARGSSSLAVTPWLVPASMLDAHALGEVGSALADGLFCSFAWAGDLDGDGRDDIVTLADHQCAATNGDRSTLSLWYGDDAPHPRSPDGTLALPEGPGRAAGIGDFDGDGFDDLAMVLEDPTASHLHIIYGAPR